MNDKADLAMTSMFITRYKSITFICHCGYHIHIYDVCLTHIIRLVIYRSHLKAAVS